MRKRVFGRQLSCDKNERKALFRALVSSLIKNQELKTTLAKAKAIQPEVEKLITQAKSGTLNDRRVALRFLTKRALVDKLFGVIGPIFKERKGGYTRIVRIKVRQGDGAQIVKILFTEEIPVETKKTETEEKSEITVKKTNKKNDKTD